MTARAVRAFRKFNPYHDARGRFTFAGAHQGGGFPLADDARAVALAERMTPWAQSLSVEEKGALQSYAGAGSVVNGVLRDKGRLSVPARRIVTAIDAAMERPEARLPDPLTVYRGVGPGTLRRLASSAAERIQDDGFISTSLDRSIAERFARGGGAVVEIELPAGTPVAYLPAGRISGASASGQNLPTAGEREMILPRGAIFAPRVDGGRRILRYVGTERAEV